MKLVVLSILLVLTSSMVHARDSRAMHSIKAALNTEQAKSQLNPSIKLFFGEQKHPKIEKSLGEYQSNKKTNAFNKSDEEACQWVFLSAVLALQDRAAAEGGNAVVNIRSYYKKSLKTSETEFECGAGAIMAGTTLKGTVVKLAD